MRLIMAGLPARDGAALGILAGMAMKGWQVDACAVAGGKPLPAADLYVIDLAGAGLPRWSAAAEAGLLQLLRGASAVVLHAASDATWPGARLSGAQDQQIVLLAKPYSAESMRAALQQASRKPAPRAARPVIAARPSPTAAVAPAPTRTGPTQHRPVQTVPGQTPPAIRRPSPPAASRVIGGGRVGTADPRAATAGADVYTPPTGLRAAMSLADLGALHRSFPDLKRHAVLDRVVQACAAGTPQEIRLSVQHVLVVDPACGWAAASSPAGVLERMCRQPELASVLAVRGITTEQARDWARRVATVHYSLDALLWTLGASVLGDAPIRMGADPELRLRAFPAFTRLPAVPDFFIQLAAICVRSPQRLSALQSAFAHQDAQLIRRFALLASLSGLGRLDLPASVPAGIALPPVRPQAPAAALRLRQPAMPASRGFFKAMLARLF